jgi:hypothetical protein
MSRTKYVICSNALGDSIVIAGGVTYIAKNFEKVAVVCHEKIFPSVSSFYATTNVEVITHKQATEREEVIEAIHGTGDFDNFIFMGTWVENLPENFGRVPWPEWLYYQLETQCGFPVPYSLRWDNCPIRESAKKLTQTPWPEGYAFMHDDPDRTFLIRKFPHPFAFQKVHNDGKSILHLAQAIEEAPEVHVIDSCFFHLTEALKPKGQLYLHRYAKWYAKGWNDHVNRYKWNIIEDEYLGKQAKFIRLLSAAALM